MADRKKLGLNLIPKGIVSQGQYSKSLTRKHPPLNYNFPRNAELDSLCLEMDFLLNKIDTKIKTIIRETSLLNPNARIFYFPIYNQIFHT